MVEAHLWSLATDVLHEIFSYINIVDIYMLSRTNAFSKQVLLARGIDRLDLDLNSLPRVYAFPICVLQYRALKTLKVQIPRLNATGLIWTDLEALPPTLEELKIQAMDAFFVFYKNIDFQKTINSHTKFRQEHRKPVTATYRPPPELSGPMKASRDNIVDLSKITPLLRTLHLEGLSISSGHALIPYLPDSITDLSIYDPNSSGPLLSVKESELSSGESKSSDYDVAKEKDGRKSKKQSFKFPASLVSLYLPACCDFDCYDALPPSVTYLMAASPPRTAITVNMLLKPLPPSLVHLDVFLPSLPPIMTHETHLDGNSENSSHQATSSSSTSISPSLEESRNRLPSTLTTLLVEVGRSNTLYNHGLMLAKILNADTPSLTDLKITVSDTCFAFDNECISLLPRGLKTLHFVPSPDLTDHFYGLLPRGLLDLWVRPGGRLSNDSLLVEALPRGIQSLRLSSLGSVPPNVLLLLPRTVTYFVTGSVYATPSWKQLPSLTSIDVNGPRSDITLDVVRSFPNNLTQLRITSQHDFTDDLVCALPRTLTCFDHRSNRSLTDQACAHFPPGLKYLKLHESDKISHIGLGQLPRKLLEIQLKGDPSGLPAHSAHLLPPTLELFKITTDVHWSDADVAQLPCTLKELLLCGAPSLTDACFPHLPRGLATLCVRLNRSFSHECLASVPPLLTKLLLKRNYNFRREHLQLLPTGLQLVSRKLNFCPYP